MRFPFDSKEAQQLNKDIFETMYFAACTASKDLAKVHGHYDSYTGCPVSKGILQYDMWGLNESQLSGRWDWLALKEEIKLYGLRNSLLLAPMPTASTSQILGNNECFEPYTSNIYVRRTLAGFDTDIHKESIIT
jgi:ribonucleotide reductase alpha subunit